MSNIEEDIKRCEKLTELQNANWIGISNQLAIAHIVEKIKELEIKQKEMCEEYCPKTEKIKELEQENRIQRRQLNSAFDRGWIPKEKVKKLKESVILDNTIVGGRRNAKTLEYGIKLGKIKAYEELLEDK